MPVAGPDPRLPGTRLPRDAIAMSLRTHPFRHSIDTAIEIGATSERTWGVLTDFAAFADWNPFVREIRGALVPATSLHVTLAPPGGRPMRIRPRVVAVLPGRAFRWLGRLGVPGLFDGEHYFVVEPIGPERCRFEHGENFSGLLVGALRASLDGPVRDGFERFNAALKTRAERG